MTRIGRTYIRGTASGVANEGYYGDASDGDLTIASGETTTIDVASEDTQVIKNYGDVNIPAGSRLETSGRCNGLILLINGDLILDGEINVDKRAPLLNDNEDAALQEPHVALCGVLMGGKGGDAGIGGIWSQPSSYYEGDWEYFKYAPGVGGNGFRLGGGYGGGGSNNFSSGGSCEPRPPIGTAIPYPSGLDVSFCGVGATGGYKDKLIAYGGKGPGGSAGLYMYYSSAVAYNGLDGDAVGGGAVWIFVKGKVRIGTTGRISACGGNGGNGQYFKKGGEVDSDGKYPTGAEHQATGGGGAGGGGIIALVHSGDFINRGSLLVSGGVGGTRGDLEYMGYSATNGEDGGVGSIFVKPLTELLGL